MIRKKIAPDGVIDLFSPRSQTTAQGVVDKSRIIKTFPHESMNKIILIEDEATARTMVLSGEISSFFVIHNDYLHSGKIDFVQKEYNFLVTQTETEILRRVIVTNLLPELETAQRYLDPMRTNLIYLSEKKDRDFGGPENFWLPYIVMMLFYMLIIGSSSMMLNSITNEKKNRTMEVLLTSISPGELLMGKTIALGIAGLIQSIVWLFSSYSLLSLAGRQFSLPEGFNLETSFFAWGLVFFTLGYILYSNLMAGLGALVPNPKEGSQATLIVIFPLIIPLFFSNLVISSPNALLFVLFSIFPLTAPISMISRLSATVVPNWQLVLSVVLLIATIILVMRNVIRLFRAQNLLSGNPFKFKEFLKTFMGK